MAMALASCLVHAYHDLFIEPDHFFDDTFVTHPFPSCAVGPRDCSVLSMLAHLLSWEACRSDIF